MSGWISLTLQKQRKVFTQTHWCRRLYGPFKTRLYHSKLLFHPAVNVNSSCFADSEKSQIAPHRVRTDNVRVIILFLLALLLVYLKLSTIIVYTVLWQEDFNRISDENIDMFLLTTTKNILPQETLWITYFWTFS